MDMYGLPPSDLFRIDDLLDFSNDDLFSSTTDPDFVHHHHHPPPLSNPVGNRPSSVADRDDTNPNNFPNFPDELGVPSDDVAELEWLSKFVDDSFADIPVNDFAGPTNLRPDASVPGRARSKRSRAASTHNSWTSPPESDILATDNSKTINKKKETSPASSVITGDQSSSSSSSSPLQSGGSALVRKCTHCASEKTPQWRTGPLGPKTLCNACGVRYKSGRLVPEYRPAASPTFVLTQHSNSHRKVLELRRQKEVVRQDSTNHHQFCRHQHHDFKVC